MKKQQEKVRRLGVSGIGVITVYTRMVDYRMMSGIEYGVAFCPSSESYSKQLGFMLAKRSANASIVYTPTNPIGRLIDVMVLVDIFKNKEIPEWAHPILEEDLDRGVNLSAKEVSMIFNI